MRLHDVPAEREGLAAEKSDHANALVLKNVDDILEKIGGDQIHPRIDIDFVLGVDVRTHLVHRCSKVFRFLKGMQLDLISLRTVDPLQGLHTRIIILLLALLNQNRDCLFRTLVLRALLLQNLDELVIHTYTPVLSADMVKILLSYVSTALQIH